MTHSESIAELAAALAKAHAEFGPIVRSKTVRVITKAGKEYTFDYAPLEDLVEATQPALSANGLAIIQSASGDALFSTLVHCSGQWAESMVPLALPVSGSKQDRGGEITHARRYGYTCLLMLTADDDDDANAASGNEVEVLKQRQEAKRPPQPSTAKQWLWAVINNMVKAERWDELGVDAAAGPLLIIKDATGDFARTALIQRLLGRMPSTPPTDEELKTAAANLSDIRDHALKMD